MSYASEQLPLSQVMRHFGPRETHIAMAEVNLLAHLGLMHVSQRLETVPLHTDFAGDALLRQAFETPSGTCRPTRFSGPLQAAIGDMCTRNMVDPETLDELLQSPDIFVGPLLFRDPYDDHLPRLTHEVTVYSATPPSFSS